MSDSLSITARIAFDTPAQAQSAAADSTLERDASAVFAGQISASAEVHEDTVVHVTVLIDVEEPEQETPEDRAARLAGVADVDQVMDKYEQAIVDSLGSQWVSVDVFEG